MWSTRRAFGQEAESGVIRADQTRVRVRSGLIHKECGHEVRRASADGAASIGGGEPGGTESSRAEASKNRFGGGVHRSDFGSGSESPAETEAHGASDLEAHH